MDTNRTGQSTVTLTPDDLIAGPVETANVFLTANVVYRRGDLLSYADVATNTVKPATDPAEAKFIVVIDMSAAEATAQASSGLMLPVYASGEFSADKVTLAGVALTRDQLKSAMGSLNQHGVYLRVRG
jgi:hypothetical protein